MAADRSGSSPGGICADGAAIFVCGHAYPIGVAPALGESWRRKSDGVLVTVTARTVLVGGHDGISWQTVQPLDSQFASRKGKRGHGSQPLSSFLDDFEPANPPNPAPERTEDGNG